MYRWNFYTTNELKPRGWLKRQLQLQAEGLAGNLDKMWPDVRDSAWVGGDREGWERVPYWLDGFIPLAYLLENEDMIARAKKYVDAIIAAQQPDGWICPCTEEERSTYTTWVVFLITKALALYYDCSKDERIPDVIYRTLKNYYELLRDGVIKLFGWTAFRWYEGFIAIDFTYQRYKEDWLPELCKILQEQGVNYDELIPLWKHPINEWRFDTHLVNHMMMLKYEAVTCDLLGLPYTDHVEKLWQILDKHNGTAVGTLTGDECLAGVSPIQGTELCAVVEQMYSYEWLYAYTGDKKWAERLEVLAFNALPATISDDMWVHQYDQMSNQIACRRFPGKPIFRTNEADAHLFGLEPNFGCCTSNMGQGWPKFTLSAFMHQGDTVINVLGVPTELTDGDRHILVETNYPFENSMKYTVEAGSAFTFKIRIPSFAKNLIVDGKPAAAQELEYRLAAGEKRVITVSFDTEVCLEERPYGLNTVKCGSLVFCVPVAFEKKMYEYEKDGVVRKFPYCDYEYIPVSDWNYAYSGDVFTRENRGVGDIPFSGEKPPVIVRAKVRKIDWGLEDGYLDVCAKTPKSTEPISGEQEMELYPYGCAKLRMTELPRI
ncbi:MAG: glycoside hydrolase family 127 protein [Oscillospiraceae bacterium]|nr:glycoside hydrolase family 127 protein [Oscillospiraceae bacterium]